MLLNRVKEIFKIILHTLKSVLIIIAAALISGMIVKAFFIGYYIVPSQSMENTLLPGDGILVSKLNYGPRVDLGSFLIFIDEHVSFGKRLPGFSHIKRGDVIVFNAPADKQTVLVKRCVAVPGDSLSIKHSNIFINNKALNFDKVLNDYRFVSADSNEAQKAINLKLSLGQWKYNSLKKAYYLSLNKSDSAYFRKLPHTLRLDKLEKQGGNNFGLFPSYMRMFWSRDNYGPLLIPGEHITISLTTVNLAIYTPVINYEGNMVTVANNRVLVNGKVTTTYTFKKNYYFAMGDNRSNSHDSRWIGFIPEEYVIGKAVMVVSSRDSVTNKTRFNRVFSSIK